MRASSHAECPCGIAEYHTQRQCKRLSIFLTPSQTKELVDKLTEGLEAK